MKKPNLDDYDNGYRDSFQAVRYTGLDSILSKAELYDRRVKLFLEIWREKQDEAGDRYSDVSGKKMPTKFSTLYFDHLIEKSVHPELDLEEDNIIMCLPEEHELKTNGFPLEAHKKLIEEAKKKFKI